MKINFFLFAISIIASVSATPIYIDKVPSVEEAADEARTLVKRESLATIASIYQSGGLAGTPVAFPEYYVDVFDGNPRFLVVEIGSAFRNIAQGSPLSATIRVGDHALGDHVNPKYPGGIVRSPAGSPRISLRGNLTKLEDPRQILLTEKLFLQRHPDAKYWLPGNPIHQTHWAQLEVSGVYFVGGFGDRAYIGEIPVEIYKSAKPYEELEGQVMDRYTPAEVDVFVAKKQDWCGVLHKITTFISRFW